MAFNLLSNSFRPLEMKKSIFLIFYSFYTWHFDKGRFSLHVSNTGYQPLAQFIMIVIGRKNVCRPLELDCSCFYQHPPDSHPAAHRLGRHAVEEEEPFLFFSFI